MVSGAVGVDVESGMVLVGWLLFYLLEKMLGCRPPRRGRLFVLFDWGIHGFTNLVGCSVQTIADPEQLAGDQVGGDRVAVTALSIGDVDHYLHMGMVLAEILERRKERSASTASDD